VISDTFTKGPQLMTEDIQSFLAPAVTFSAVGFLCMAQFARFTAVVAQVRVFNRDRLAALQAADGSAPEQHELLAQHALGLEQQAEKVLASAGNALLLLVGGILLMVLCTVIIGASLVLAPYGAAVVGLFVLGVVSTFAGLCLVLAELRVRLKEIRFEHDNLGRLRRGEELLPLTTP
jgi:hypothetical protein